MNTDEEELCEKLKISFQVEAILTKSYELPAGHAAIVGIAEMPQEDGGEVDSRTVLSLIRLADKPRSEVKEGAIIAQCEVHSQADIELALAEFEKYVREEIEALS